MYDNKNKGVLFKNDKKENEKQPDFTGKINIEGKDFRLAAWKKESKNGKTFLSINVSDFDEKYQNNNNNNANNNNFSNDEDIPF